MTDDFEISEKINFDEFYADKFLEDWKKLRNRHQGQQAILDAFSSGDYKSIFVQAGRKFSKTTTIIDIAWPFANLVPNRVIYLLYPSIAAGTEIIWEEKRLQRCDIQETYMFDRYVEKIDETRHILRFVNGSYIKLIGTWTEARGRGTQPDLLLYDEVQDCNPAYMQAMDSNLGPKDAAVIMCGTPSKTPGHYQQWRERIRSRQNGKVFHYTSYANDSIPHLKRWLDEKKEELIKAGEEDVWRREYLAEDCFSSADRVLPDVIFHEKAKLLQEARNFSYKERVPILAISVHGKYFCAILACLNPQQHLFILDKVLVPQVWCNSFANMYPLLKDKTQELQDFCGKKLRKVVWDESDSFVDIISGFAKCRKDPKWQDRGIPLLKELIVNKKISFAQEIGEFGLECQNILMDEKMPEIQKKYPFACGLSMLVNEYFQSERKPFPDLQKFDKYQALREMGIPCEPKKNKRLLFSSRL